MEKTKILLICGSPRPKSKSATYAGLQAAMEGAQAVEGVEVELSKTFTFGKRGANIALAKSEQALSEALLADYFRQLRADATVTYL